MLRFCSYEISAIDCQELECKWGSGTTFRAASITESFLREPARIKCSGHLTENAENDSQFHPNNAISLCLMRKRSARGLWHDHRCIPSLVLRCLHHSASAKRFTLKCIKDGPAPTYNREAAERGVGVEECFA